MSQTEEYLEGAASLFAMLRDLAHDLSGSAESENGEDPSALWETARRVRADARHACEAVADTLSRSSLPAVGSRAAHLRGVAHGTLASEPSARRHSYQVTFPSSVARDVLPRLERLATATPRYELEDLVGVLEAVLSSPPSAAPDPPSRGFSEAELMALDRAGIDVDRAPQGDPRGAAHEAYARLLAEALPPEEAARRLGVDKTRVYQRLADRTLYGVRLGRRWGLPLFQFTDSGEVPGIGVVLAALPRTMHPLSVVGWFTTPQDDLRLDAPADPKSPREWLVSGGSAAAAAALAADLEVPL